MDLTAFVRRAFSAAWSSSREQAVYGTMILVPLVALALVAAFGGDSSRRVTELPNGGNLRWIFPRSAIREVLVYAGVALWLLRELGRRMPDEFRRTIWRAPVIIGIANVLLAAPFVLVHGSVRQVLAEQSGLIGVRFLVRIIVACGYVALVEWIQAQLQQEGAFEDGKLTASSPATASGCHFFTSR